MKLLLVIDSHIYKTVDGKYWCKGITDKSFFERYLNVFEKIKIVSRVQEIDNIDDEKFLRVDAENMEFVDIPFVRSTKEYIKKYRKIKKILEKEITDCQCIIYRLPSILSYIAYLTYRRLGKAYGIEVVADPEEAYRENWIIKTILKKMLQKIALNANGVSYVTEKFLQEKYPSRARKSGESDKYFETYYSSIDLKEDFFGTPKYYKQKKEYVISHMANISSSMVKGQDIVIKVAGMLCQKGYKVKIKFIGDSEIKEKYFSIAEKYGIKEQVHFTGLLPRKEQIREELLQSDIFLLPTKSEGLPRSILEAMAVGLPCISTPIAGIPELLPKELLIEQSDYQKFANIIEDLIKKPIQLEKISKRNIEKAKEYKDNILSERRNKFYCKLKNVR